MEDLKSIISNLKFNLKGGLIIAAVVLVVIIVLAVYFTWPSKEEQPLEEELTPEVSGPEASEPGPIGEMEIEEGKTMEEALGEVNPEALENPVRPPGTSIPPVVFNTKGTITSVQEDGIMLEGNGSNFEDQKSRVLTVKFTDKTITFEKGNIAQYQGKEGLKHLSPGDKILIESSQNIRGKTEFTASYINKI